MLALEVGEEELVKRLLKRGETSSRSDDTNEAVIRQRIAVYHSKTAAVADYYKGFDKAVYLKGEGTVDEIFGRICGEIDSRIVSWMINIFKGSKLTGLPFLFIKLTKSNPLCFL